MTGLKAMARADDERSAPAWLRLLLDTEFFEVCPEHPDASRATRSGGCNIFCIDCTGRPLCSACIPGQHDDHQIIQIRRSSKHNVVKVKDVEALLNVEEVQTYLINGDLVVFLNQRPMEGKGKAGDYRCDNCDRALLKKAFRFCSLGCKLACMDEDFDISFAVPPKREDETESDEGPSSHPTKRLKVAGGGNNAKQDDATGPSTAPAEPPTTTPSSSRRE